MKLQNKVTIVTGGAQGMGRAIGLRYAQEGAHVVVADLKLDGAQKVVDEIGAAAPSPRSRSVASSSQKMWRQWRSSWPPAMRIILPSSALMWMAATGRANPILRPGRM